MPLPRQIHRILPLFLLTLALAGCATTKENNSGEFPPILTQDKLTRPYVQLGKIQITRDVYGPFDYEITPDIREWGLEALRREAAKMGADAVTYPEITGNSFTFIFIPSTEYRATGEAIKFK